MSPEILVAIVIVALVIVITMVLPTLGQRQVNKELIKQRWSQIQAALRQGGIGPRHALMEADKLLDYVLIQQGYRGNTMAERLKNAEFRFRNKNQVWLAHKLRNQLVHEAEFSLADAQAKKALAAFQRALKELRVL
jgi:hypothetical protein